MKFFRIAMLLVAAALLFGCASKMNDVRLGMTREEVVGAVGSPSSTSEIANNPYAVNRLTRRFPKKKMGISVSVETRNAKPIQSPSAHSSCKYGDK